MNYERKRDIDLTEYINGHGTISVKAKMLLGMLTYEQRVCIVLRDIEEMTYEDIAGMLGIDVNDVQSHLKRARDRMLEVTKRGDRS